MSVRPSSTEVYCFNSRPYEKSQGCGNPAVLFPCAQRANEEFFKPTYGRLKDRILLERRIPVDLLDLLSGKSSKERRDSDGSLSNH